jgi:molybdopterin-synthase adenylyltransferase
MKTVKISECLFTDLRKILFKDSPRENAAFLLIGLNRIASNEVYLVRRIIEIPEHLFIEKNEYHLEISSQAINGIISLCEENKLGLALCHSHPFTNDKLNYSSSDDYGERNINRIFKKILPDLPLVSILFGKEKIIGRYWNRDDTTKTLDNIEIIGNSLTKIQLNNDVKTFEIVDTKYNRQISAFGEDGQRKIIQTKVGIVGTGGTGSIIAEQLVRLGVVDIKISDKDIISETNLTRMYGTYYKDVKKSKLKFFHRPKYKVDIIERHLKSINPKVKIIKFHKSIVFKEVADEFIDRDVLFSCTDDHWGRSILNQMSYQYLIPLINTGVRLTTDKQKFTAGNIVSHLIGPDKPCLWCYEYLKSKIIEAESMKPESRENLIKEGYIENINIKQPSVITFTSLASCMGMEIFLNLITGYLGEYGKISSIRHDMLNLDMRRGIVNVKKNCICKKVYAKGNSIPLYTI